MASLLSISLLLLAFSFPLRSFSARSYRADVRTKDVDRGPVLESGHSTLSIGFNPSRAVQLSWRPRAFLYEGFLSDEECDHLISLAHGKLEKSMVMDRDTGKSVIAPYRTSSGMFLGRDQDEIVARIEDRISAWTFLPKENGESMQLLHYGIGEKYDPHHDYYLEKSRLAFGGHRIATVLMYLSNVTFGGETIFPNSEHQDPQVKDSTWSYCATTAAYAVKAIKGNAVLFFSLHPNATVDERSLHGGCPVIEGEKWSATKWIHVKSIDMGTRSLDDGECTDEEENCPEWAAVGECEKNPVYMVGSPDYYGTCRKSCHVC